MHEVDLLGGTPPPDIKPYVRRFDHRDAVRGGWVGARRLDEVKGWSFTPEGLREHGESSRT